MLIIQRPTVEAIDEEEANRRGTHSKGYLPNPKVETAAGKEMFWDCPICGRAQAPRDREFNDHIDYCLSRQTIKEAVKDTGGGERKRGLEVDERAAETQATEGSVDAKRRRFFG